MLSDLNNLAASDGLISILAILVLIAIGFVLIFSGSGERTKTVSKRIDHMQDTSGARKRKTSQKQRPGNRITPQAPDGMAEAEHRQIIRAFAKLGIPAKSACSFYQTTRLLLVIVFAGITVPFAKGLFAISFAVGLFVIIVPAALGWLLPSIFLSRSVAARSRAVNNGLPDALELLAVCIEAGISLENGLQRVATELKRSQPELADELAETWAEINILPDRDQALVNLAERVNTACIRSVVSTLSQTLRYGTPLARSLRVVASDVRADQLTAVEEKANRLPAMMTIPVMLFIMPTIFLIIGGPAGLKLMDIMMK